MTDLDHVEQLKSCGEPTFRELYEIYAASIAVREQKPEEWICAMVRAPEYRVWVMKGGGRVESFSILFLPPSERFALLEYMAVAPERRNHGRGRCRRNAPTSQSCSRSTLTEKRAATGRFGRAGSSSIGVWGVCESPGCTTSCRCLAKARHPRWT